MVKRERGPARGYLSIEKEGKLEGMVRREGRKARGNG